VTYHVSSAISMYEGIFQEFIQLQGLNSTCNINLTEKAIVLCGEDRRSTLNKIVADIGVNPIAEIREVYRRLGDIEFNGYATNSHPSLHIPNHPLKRLAVKLISEAFNHCVSFNDERMGFYADRDSFYAVDRKWVNKKLSADLMQELVDQTKQVLRYLTRCWTFVGDGVVKRVDKTHKSTILEILQTLSFLKGFDVDVAEDLGADTIHLRGDTYIIQALFASIQSDLQHWV
jgi:hypothetical protein